MNTHPKAILLEQEFDKLYVGVVDDNEITLEREHGKSPNGNDFGGVWVLRVDGEYIDHDQYRSDLCERRNLQLKD
jgi:hypothetical protein